METPNDFGAGANERHNLTIPFQDNELFKAFSVSQGMYWAQRYAVDVGGMSQNKTLRVAYPAAGSFCFDMAGIFGSSGSYVCGIEAVDWNDWNTIMHEYGHFVQGMKGILGQGLWDYIIYGMEHSGWEDQIQKTGNKTHGLQLSWSEAWAYTFAMMAYNQYSAVYGTRAEIIAEINIYGGFGTEAVTNARYANRGEAQENAMIALLWDLFGARNTNLLTDTWTPRGHAEFWSVSAQSGTYTMSVFADRLNTTYPQHRNQIGTRLSYFKIAPQALTITNAPNGSTPPSFSWRVNGSQNNPNNQFRIAFYNTSGVQQYETGNLIVIYTVDPANPTRNDLRTATATLTQSQWEAALAAFPNGGMANVAVKGYLNSSPVSGPYWSGTQSISVNYARLTYAAVSGGLAVTGSSFMPSSGVVDIPATYNGQAVVAIAANAFSGQNGLFQVIIPSSITSIGDSAFKNCTGLGSISIPSSVISIGDSAFSNCTNLSSITLSANQITGMGSGVFTGCNNLYITVQGASVGLNWYFNWNGNRPVTFTVSGGCGLTHSIKYTANGVTSHTLSCNNCTAAITENHSWLPYGTTQARCAGCKLIANLVDIPVINRIPVEIQDLLIAAAAENGGYAQLYLADGFELCYIDGQFCIITDTDGFTDDVQEEFFSTLDWFYRIIEQLSVTINYAYD